MSTLIVGKELYKIPKVIMSNSDSFSVLRKKWQKFARKLGVPEESVLELKLKHDRRSRMRNLEDFLVDLLSAWKGTCGDDATLEVLGKALRACKLKDVADHLEKEFGIVINEQILTSGVVSVQGQLMHISDIFATTADFPSTTAPQFSKNDPIEILKTLQIPSRPSYYVHRSLSPRTRLNAHVFESSTSDDVFVLENLGTLDDKLFGSKIERSSSQTRCVTAKFILLDFKKDYNRICQVVPTSTPVHLVRFDKGSYHLVRSRGSQEFIQQYVSSDQTEWSELAFVKMYLSRFHNAPVCIAGAAGMGKSLLLASIAQMVKEVYPERVVIFLTLSKLRLTKSKAVDLFFKQITTSTFAAEALKRVIESGKLQVELFLDGFDEVLPNQIEPVKQLLQNLKQYWNIRVHVTTRSHMRSQLEETVGVLCFNLLPFSRDNQVDFLMKFWGNCEESNIEEFDESRVRSFAEKCLLMNELEQDIVGVPLQCVMLAELFACDAGKYSINQNTKFELTYKVESIVQTFQQLIRKKIRVEALGKVEKQQLLLAHVHEAVKLMFPDSVDKLTCIQNNKVLDFQTGYSETFLAKLYAVGLMEPSSSVAGARPRFVHRTFAEFIIAEHLVKHLGRCAPCSRLLVHVVLGELVRSPSDKFIFQFYDDTRKSFYPQRFQFRHNLIAYFVNAHLNTFGDNFETPGLKSSQNLERLLSACCVNNYPNVFDLLSKVVSSKREGSKAWAHLMLLAARYSDCSLMEQLVKLVQQRMKLEIKFPEKDFGFRVTPLHVAVQRGSDILTKYLVAEKICPTPEYLFHSCVYNSSKDSDPIIEEKIEIIKFLAGRNKKVVNERLPGCNLTPFLLPNVHVHLIQALIEQGAVVNAVDAKGDTLLHIICKSGREFDPVSTSGYTKVFNLLRSSKFNLWEKKGENDETPLHLAVKNIEVEHSVLEQYYQLNVDFNCVNKFGDSVLFAAIRGGRTLSFIKKLEQHGTDVNYINTTGESALHIAVEHGNYEVTQYLLTDRNFDVNIRDLRKQTPLHAAVLQRSANHIAIQALLIDNGAELGDPKHKWRLTPLYHALARGNGINLYIVKKMVAKGLGSEHLALALDPLVSNENIKPGGKGSPFINLFRYLYQHGGRIQNSAKKLRENGCKWEFVQATVINDELLEQLQVITGINRVVLDRIQSASDLYDRIVSRTIPLELAMLALLECDQLRAFEAIRPTLDFGCHMPEVEEFIYHKNNMLVVATKDVEICAKNMLHTFSGVVEEFREGRQLFPGTLCLVKVKAPPSKVKFLDYLSGLEQLPYRFIVIVCKKSVAREVKRKYEIVQWNP